MHNTHIGTVNAQGEIILRSIPHKIRVTHNGEALVLEHYTGPVHQTEHGQIEQGDYIAFGTHRTAEWVIRNPTQWERVS